MKPRGLHSLLLGSLCVAFYCLCHADNFLKSGNHEWKKLIMVHHWPATVCKEIENECTEPPDYWTIHGLWPDKAEDCNGSWHFNLDEIKDLLPAMKEYWPDLVHPNRSHFWKHEWEKHGTCAAQLDSLNSEKKYFGTSLHLYEDLDLNSMLQKLGIKPSLNYYQISDIKDALASVYGVIPKVQCLPPKQDEDVQLIAQIELCLTKGLQLRNCSEPEPHPPASSPTLSVCDEGPAFYPPPRRAQLKRFQNAPSSPAPALSVTWPEVNGCAPRTRKLKKCSEGAERHNLSDSFFLAVCKG